MNNACPNTNSPEWKNLVKELGEGDALTAFVQNNNEIPSVEKAKEILNNITILEKDEQVSRRSDETKLKRSVEQRSMLERVKLNANIAQKETIDRLIAMNNEYQEFLNENLAAIKAGKEPRKTVSVSNFIGSSDFKGDPKEYEAFKRFGTFMHEVIEFAQSDAIKSGETIGKVFTRDYFEKLYDKYTKRFPFHIENFTLDEMYVQALGIIQSIDVKNIEKYVILPEITVVGTASTGSKIIGRVDLMLIDPQGKIEIYDFKTKKTMGLISQNPDGSLRTDVNPALIHLADKQFPMDMGKAGVADTFREIENGKRSAFDTWTVQLDIYDQILRQSGMNVSVKKIAALLYQTDEDKKFLASVLHIFGNQDYYEQTMSTGLSTNRNWFHDPTVVTQKIDALKRAIRKEIKVEGETETGEKVTPKTIEETFEFIPSDESMKRFTESLNFLIDGQIDEINRKLTELDESEKKNPKLEELLKIRKDSLMSFRKIVQSNMNNPTAILQSANFFSAMDHVSEDLLQMSNISDQAIKSFREKKSIKASSDELSQSTQAFQKSSALLEIIDVMEDILNEASREEGSKITNDSPSKLKIANMRLNHAAIESNFREISLEAGIDILKEPGQQVFEAVDKDMQATLGLEIISYQKEIEKLKNGQGLGVLKNLKSSFLSFISKDFKERLAEQMDPASAAVMMEIENLERKIKVNQAKLSGYKFDDESLKNYINGVTDPDSVIYLGSPTWNNDSLLKGFKTDSFIASASNSEIGISAWTMMFKNAQAQASWNMQSDTDLIEFDKLREKLVEKYGLDTLNDMISEWRDVVYFDRSTGAIKTKKMFYLTKPYSEEYEKQYKEYSLQLKIFNREIDDLRAEHNSLIGKVKNNTATKADVDIAEKLLLDKLKEKTKYRNDHIDWMLKNSNNPYIDDFYTLQKGIPEDLSDMLQKLYLEAEVIRESVGRGNEITLEAEDFDRLKDIEVEIKKIRNEAKERDPKYADFIDKFNDLFEYDVNQRYYNAMEENAKMRFADSPDLLQKWYEENTVTRPTAEWYSELEDLYEQRKMFFEPDEDLQDLYEQKRKLLSPYKDAGRIDPRRLTDEDVQELDQIEWAIDQKLAELEIKRKAGGSQLTKEDRAALAEINSRINSLVVNNQVNILYKKDFDNRTNMLYQKMNRYQLLETKLEDAKSKGKETEELKKDYIAALNDFTEYEEKYKQYYEKNHTNRYISITTGYDVKLNANIKGFNYERLPSATVRAKYMETVPNPKYYKIKKVREKRWYLDGVLLSTKEINSMDPQQVDYYESEGRLRKLPGGLNPDFIKGPDGIPLPKGVYKDIDGNFKVRSGYESSNNINKKYLDIMSNPEISQFYEATTKLFFNKQRQIEGRKNGWQIPGFASSSIEDISREGFTKAFGRSWEKYKDKNLKFTNSEQDMVDNVFGDAGSRIRMRFTEQLSEELQSKDAIGSIMKYVTEAHYNMAMQDVSPKAEAFIEYLKLQRKQLAEKIAAGPVYKTEEVIRNGKKIKSRVEVDMKSRLAELNNVIEVMEFERRKLLYGQLETDKNRALKKVMNQVFAYTSFVRIGFDITNQVKNYISGNVQSFIAASGYDSAHYLRSNWVYAKKKVYAYDGFLANYFRDYGKVTGLHESTMLYRFFNPLQKDQMKYYAHSSGSKNRRILEKTSSIGEMSHLLQDKGDTEIGVTVMYAVLDHYTFTELQMDANGNMVPKLDAEGKEVKIPAHECYIKGPNGELVRRNDVNYTVEDEKRLRNIIYSEMRRAQGNYASSDMTKSQESVLGKMAFFFRKFLVPGLLNRFGYLRPNWEAGEMSLGYWRALWDCHKHFGTAATLKEFLLGSKLLKKMNMEGATTIKIKDPATGNIEVKDIGDFYAKKLSQARQDMIAMGILLVMSLLVKAYIKKKDEDDEELSMLEGNMFRVIWGVQAETASMFPLGGGSNEYIKNFTTAVPFVRELQQSIKFTNHMLKYGLAMTINGGDEPDPDYDSEYYQEIYKDAFFQRKSGAYEKGDAKIKKDLIDLTGIKNFRDFFDPNYRIDIMKRNQ